MKKKTIVWIIVSIIVLALVIWFIASRNKNLEDVEVPTNEMTATVIAASEGVLTVQDRNDIIYTFNDFESDDVLEANSLYYKMREIR